MLEKLGVRFSKDLKTYGTINLRISPKSDFHIGENVIIRSHWRNNPAGGGQNKCIITVNQGAKLDIGRNVGISNSTIYCSKEIEIQENVLIGVNCVIYDTDFHSVVADYRINGNRNIQKEKVTLKRGSWIGGHCIILKGVTIGENSVVGAGSVVTKDIPDNEIWAGNPAKLIRCIDENLNIENDF
ncbi:MAG: acyltransferase [Lachnospiraceae bacterium]|nr:acyltransferase [Lachnospiraceae bacterium]